MNPDFPFDLFMALTHCPSSQDSPKPSPSRGGLGGDGVKRQCCSVKRFQVVIPAQAGIQWALAIAGRWMRRLDSRLRGNDEIRGLPRLTEPCWVKRPPVQHKPHPHPGLPLEGEGANAVL